MALQDPQDGYVPLDTVVPAAVAPAPWEWPAQFQVDPADYGVFAPTDQQIGGTAGVIENAAAPALAAPPPPADPAAIAALDPLAAIDQGVAKVSPGGSLEGMQGPAPDQLAGWDGHFGPAKAFDDLAGKVASTVGPAAADARADADTEGRSSMLASDPARLMREEFDLESERAARDREMLEQERANNRESADLNAQMQLAALTRARAETERLNAEATAIANTKIVRDRRSGGSRLFDVILGALGGLVAARTGGPNVGLNLVLKRLDDDVEDQKAELQNRTSAIGMKRNFIADELARSGDMFKAQEMYRLALHDSAISDISSESMKFAPGGTRAIQLAKMKAGLMQSRAAALRALEDRNLKTASDSANIEHRLLENKKLRGQLSGGGGGGGAARVAFGEQAFQSITPPAGWAGSQKQWIDQRNAYLTGKKSEQEISSGGKLGEEERANKLVRGGMPISDYEESGKPRAWIPQGDVSTVNAFRAKYAATREAVRLLDEAVSLRTGWTSDTGNSDENARLKVIMGKAKLTIKNAEKLGQITATDDDLIVGALGAADFTVRKSLASAIDQARKNLMQSIRIEAEALGLSPRGVRKIDFPNLYGHKHVETSGERIIKEKAYEDSVAAESDPQPFKRDIVTGEITYGYRDIRNPFDRGE